MNRTLKSLSVLLTAVAALAVSGLGAAQPARAASATAHAAKGTAPAVKVSRNQVNKGAKKTVSKASRGPGDLFHIDNHTGYAVDIYVGGDYKGTVGPAGDLYIADATGGDYTATASAPGTGLVWGPVSFSTPFTWRLF